MDRNAGKSTPSTDNQQSNVKSWAGQRPIEIERELKCAVEQLWQSFSNPELVKQWWGPKNFTCPSAKIDFREGGKYLLAMQPADGEALWSTGTYLTLSENKKIAYTDQFANQNGEVISPREVGMDDFPMKTLVTIEFKNGQKNLTTMTLKHEGIPESAYADCTSGWNETIDKLQRVVERN